MGMDIGAKLIYGTTYKSLEEEVETLDVMLDDGVLDYASPYYDSPRSEWIVGVEIGNTHANEATLALAVKEAKWRFHDLTEGVSAGEIIVAAHVW